MFTSSAGDKRARSPRPPRTDLDALGPDGDGVRVVEELSERLNALQQDLNAAKEANILAQMRALDSDLMREAQEGGGG